MLEFELEIQLLLLISDFIPVIQSQIFILSEGLTLDRGMNEQGFLV